MAVEGVLRELEVPGRLQRLRHGATEVLLDVAHNPHAARALAERLDDADGPQGLLFGAFADKDVVGVVAPIVDRLGDRLEAVTLVDTPGSRGLPAAALAERLAPLHLPAVRTATSPVRGLDDALARVDGGRLLVCGSFTVVGAVLAVLGAEAAA